MQDAFWLATPYRARAPLRGNCETDVAIVGAGITGATLAYLVSKTNLRATLIEEEVAGHGASGRNAGLATTGLGEHYVNSLRTHGAEGAREIWRVNHDNVELLEKIVKEAQLECGFMRTGGLAVASTETEAAELKASALLATRDGYACNYHDGVETNDLLGSRDFVGSLLQPSDAQLDPVLFTRGLLDAAERGGVPCFERTAALRVERDGEDRVLRTSEGSIRAKWVILATNADGRRFSPFLANHTSRVSSGIVVTSPLEHVGFQRPAYTDHGKSFWRSVNGRLLFGTGDADVPDRGTARSAAQLAQPVFEEFVASHFPSLAYTIDRAWAGTMCYSLDGLPIVGQLPEDARIFFSGAYTGHGFGYAQMAAKWILDSILRGEPRIPARFQPLREYARWRRPPTGESAAQ